MVYNPIVTNHNLSLVTSRLDTMAEPCCLLSESASRPDTRGNKGIVKTLNGKERSDHDYINVYATMKLTMLAQCTAMFTTSSKCTVTTLAANIQSDDVGRKLHFVRGNESSPCIWFDIIDGHSCPSPRQAQYSHAPATWFSD